MIDKKILIVEDEGTARVRLRRLLDSWGYVPIVTVSGEMALQQVSEARPMLVLMDIKLMGGIDGITTATELRAQYNLPVVYLTAYVDEELLQRARATEPYGYLVKPVQDQELRATLEMALSKCYLDRQLRESKERYRAVMTQALEGIFLVDIETRRIVEANPALERLLGYAAGETHALSIYDIEVQHRAALEHELAQCLINRQHSLGARQYRRKDGAMVDVEVNASLITYDSRQMLSFAAHDITAHKRSEDILRRRARELAMLNRASQAFSSSLDLQQVFTTVLDEVRGLMNAVGASIWLIDVDSSEIVCRHSSGLGSETVCEWRLPLGQGIVGWTAQHGESVISADTRTDERYFRDVESQMGMELRSILSVPLRVNDNVIGALQVVDRRRMRFDDADRVLLESLAASAAIAIANARLFEQAQVDIARRERAEADLLASERQYQTILEAMGDAIHVVDADLRFIFINRAFKRWVEELGMETSVEGQHLFEVYPFLTDETRAEYEQVIATGEVIITEEHSVIGGRKFITETRKIPIIVEDEVIQVITTIRDITARKRAEEALRESEEQLRVLVESSEDIIVMQDLEGHYLYYNGAARYGLTTDDLLGRTPYDIHETSKAAEIMGMVHAVAADGQPKQYEQGVMWQGELQWFNNYLYPIKDATGNVDAVGTICRNITERKRAEDKLEHYAAELERVNTELQQLAYAVSHDVAAPLRVLKFEAEQLREHCHDIITADDVESLDYIIQETTWMQRLVDDLREYSHVDSQGAAFAPLDCEAIVEQVLQRLRLDIEERAATVTHDALPVVRGDESQLEQLFQNLISNAIKFHREEEPPRVHISAFPSPQPFAKHTREGAPQRGEGDEGMWIFSVRDNGIGIAADSYERIFLCFQRLHTREEYDGTGIGLAICKRIVERHGGRIWLESEVGAGTTFYFTLPRGEE